MPLQRIWIHLFFFLHAMCLHNPQSNTHNSSCFWVKARGISRATVAWFCEGGVEGHTRTFWAWSAFYEKSLKRGIFVSERGFMRRVSHNSCKSTYCIWWMTEKEKQSTQVILWLEIAFFVMFKSTYITETKLLWTFQYFDVSLSFYIYSRD